MNSVKFLQIEPTTRCNFSCKFCCGRYMEQTDLSFERFQQIINEFPEIQHIELQGEGEPLIIPQFFDMAKLAQSRGIKISIITNGSMFSSERIDKILKYEIESIMVSIESPNPQDFKEIRGGRLENVINGLKALLKTRKERGQKIPAVGFAVTVLKRTQDTFPLIVELYNQLGMDGKIHFQFLNRMDAYSQIYSDTVSQELLSEEEQTILRTKYAKFLQSTNCFQSEIKHFYEELLNKSSHVAEFLPSQEDGSAGEATNLPKLAFRSCPWLDNALYVNREGNVTACCSIKDTDKFSLGKVGENTAVEIVNARNDMREKLRGGIIPEACRNCVIAESISARLLNLLEKKPRVSKINPLNEKNNLNSIENQLIGITPDEKATFDLILQFCNGETTCVEIINKICQRWKSNINVTRMKILPVIDELLIRKVITI